MRYIFLIFVLKVHNIVEFLLKQLDYLPSFSLSDSQLSYTFLTIRS